MLLCFLSVEIYSYSASWKYFHDYRCFVSDLYRTWIWIIFWTVISVFNLDSYADSFKHFYHTLSDTPLLITHFTQSSHQNYKFYFARCNHDHKFGKFVRILDHKIKFFTRNQMHSGEDKNNYQTGEKETLFLFLRCV